MKDGKAAGGNRQGVPLKLSKEPAGERRQDLAAPIGKPAYFCRLPAPGQEGVLPFSILLE
jgi:hypothetical protein